MGHLFHSHGFIPLLFFLACQVSFLNVSQAAACHSVFSSLIHVASNLAPDLNHESSLESVVVYNFFFKK